MFILKVKKKLGDTLIEKENCGQKLKKCLTFGNIYYTVYRYLVSVFL